MCLEETIWLACEHTETKLHSCLRCRSSSSIQLCAKPRKEVTWVAEFCDRCKPALTNPGRSLSLPQATGRAAVSDYNSAYQMNNDRSRMCSQIGRGTRTQRTSAAPVSEIDKALGVTGYRQPKSLSTAATQVGTSSAAPKYKEQASRGGGGYGGRDRAYGNGNGGDPMADLSKQYGELQVSAGGARGEGQYGQRRRRHRDRGQNRYSADRYLGHSSGEEDGKAYAPPTYTSGTSRRKSSRRY